PDPTTIYTLSLHDALPICQGKFDPVKYIEETATLSKQLQTEIGKRKELEQEIEHIKKGSIAVIKYVKTQQLKAGTSPEVRKRLEDRKSTRLKSSHDQISYA